MMSVIVFLLILCLPFHVWLYYLGWSTLGVLLLALLYIVLCFGFLIYLEMRDKK